MEKLYAQCLLWAVGFGQSYADALHAAFRDKPESPILFSLEDCLTDAGHSLSLLETEYTGQGSAAELEVFAKELFSGLQAVYHENRFSLPVFGSKCHCLWEALPEGWRYQQPFHTLEYAQDSLGWGDEDSMRAHLEAAFVKACG
ncbi:MAG: hypothetical protein J6K73_09935 [Clostridia bacterium]|nr:hypothetical protein [Clostridia bacterium]MBP3650090.1 hypothetical protein [Clostridia bacterium]